MKSLLKKIAISLLLLLWIVGVSLYYIVDIFGVKEVCVGDDVYLAEVCSNFYYLHYLIYIAVLSAYGVFVCFYGRFIKATLLVSLLMYLLYWARDFTLTEFRSVQVFSYEYFITTFYMWISFITTLFASALLFPSKQKTIIKFSIIFTLLSTIYFALEGRGSSEQITPLIGGILAELSWEKAWFGKLIKMIIVFLIAAPVFAILATIFEWIKSGKISLSTSVSPHITVIFFIVISAITLLSIPIGNMLNKRDVDEAMLFIDALIPKMKSYYDEHEEYPKRINDMLGDPPPRLINNFDYLAYSSAGAFYFSRPQKYCFVFQDPGKNFGYYSVTSDDNIWRFFKKSGNLADIFENICDENGAKSHEDLVAKHLGLYDAEDPFGKFSNETGEVIRPAITQAASEKLQEQIDVLGEIDPSIYGQPTDDIVAYPEKTTLRDLRRALQLAPITKEEIRGVAR